MAFFIMEKSNFTVGLLLFFLGHGLLNFYQWEFFLKNASEILRIFFILISADVSCFSRIMNC